MKAVILAGGIGSRLWPLSRDLYPKQLLRLLGKHSLLQSTVLRAVSCGVSELLIVASHAHRFYIAEHVAELDLPSTIKLQILLEPLGKNTAGAIGLAASLCQADDVLWVMPADHLLELKPLQQVLSSAQQLAEKEHLVTFGIEPRYPETGYGYIRQGDAIAGDGFTVEGFFEKPDLATAKQYCAGGDMFWNSGMFCFQAGTYLSQLQSHQPAIAAAVTETVAQRFTDLGFIKFPEAAYSQCPDESIDIAVMEKTTKAAVVPLAAKWSDIGSWNALYDEEDKDQQANVIRGDVLAVDTQQSLLLSHSRMLAVVGLENIGVIETADAVLVFDRAKDQAVKQLVSKLKQQQRSESHAPVLVYRPWGRYEVVHSDECCEIRRVRVKPGQSIPAHVSPLAFKTWVIQAGTAVLTVAGEEQAGAMVQIQRGQMHSLRNGGSETVVLIEQRFHVLPVNNLVKA